jgi:hypothetical protein
VRRASEKAWVKSYCDRTDRVVHLQRIDLVEDRIDVKAARAALKEPGRRIPWAELKKTLGL